MNDYKPALFKALPTMLFFQLATNSSDSSINNNRTISTQNKDGESSQDCSRCGGCDKEEGRSQYDTTQ
jgi:hypothetical protein